MADLENERNFFKALSERASARTPDVDVDHNYSWVDEQFRDIIAKSDKRPFDALVEHYLAKYLIDGHLCACIGGPRGCPICSCELSLVEAYKNAYRDMANDLLGKYG